MDDLSQADMEAELDAIERRAGFMLETPTPVRWCQLGVVPTHVVESREIGGSPPSAVWGRRRS